MQGDPISIRCHACGARFRFDRSLIAGYRGARFRCRRCGHPIFVSVPDVPSAPRGHAGSGFRADPREPRPFPNADPLQAGGREPAAARAIRLAPMADHVAQEAPAVKPMQNNLVELHRVRESQRGPAVSDARESSDRISRYILSSAPLSAEDAPEVSSAEPPVHRVVTDSIPDGKNKGLAGTIRSGGPDSPKRVAPFPFIRILLLSLALGAALAYIGFRLVLHLAG